MFTIADHPAVKDLPVLAVLGDVARALASAGAAVLVAPPGAGKTTVVPLALAEDGSSDAGRIIVLEPRRLAARAAASRMSALWGDDGVGGHVGYRMRGETRVGRATRIEVVTEGVLTRMLQADPLLGGVGLVVFDEFHERSVHADMGLAMVLHARSLLRPDLRVLVMSATLDTAPVSELLGGVPVVTSEGRAHPIETRWRPAPVEGWIEPAVAAAVLRALDEEGGDILVFLPGAAEIRRTERRLAEAEMGSGVEVRPLYGNLSERDQAGAIEASAPGRRKVVLATAIAETSLTIEGVRVVIDGGLMRVSRFDPGIGMSRLETVRVTRDSAAQRRGRAGRTGPGVCYRLWTRAEERGLVPHRRPEILEADLAPLALELAVWGADPGELRWLDPPPDAAFAQAVELLRDLEAVDADGAATAHGRRIARLGIHPRFGHMLLRGAESGLGAVACDLAALLSERDVLRGDDNPPDVDLHLRLELLRGFRGESRRGAGGASRVRARTGVRGVAGSGATGATERVDRGALRNVARESARLRRALSSARGSRGSGEADGSRGPASPGEAVRADDGVGVLTALAYPDRIGQRRVGERGRFLLRNGRGAGLVGPQSLEAADWIVAAEVDGRGAEARIFRGAQLTLADIEAHFADQVRDLEEVFWDGASERVVARRRRALGALTIGEGPLAAPDAEAVTAALLVGVRDGWPGALPWTQETAQLRERLDFLHGLDPGSWPESSDAALLASLGDWLGPFLTGLTRLTDLRKVDLAGALLSRVPPEAVGRIDALAPTHVEVPSGSRVRVDYSDPDAPVLAVRLQEVFGLLETPTVGGGRVALTMHLLSPARRPVQVTRDLASFWRAAYFEVRKDLRGRYPKHHWPEDPLVAEPTRGTGRRGRGRGPGRG